LNVAFCTTESCADEFFPKENDVRTDDVDVSHDVSVVEN
jgi:hypothetical protein